MQKLTVNGNKISMTISFTGSQQLKFALLTLIATILLSPIIAFSEDNFEVSKTLDYSVKNGAFETTEGPVPSGCFGQLMTELNGDDTVAAIFLNRTPRRGCIDANDTFPGGEGDEVKYKIVDDLGDDTWNIRICQIVHGSMRETCSNVTVKFTNRKYTYNSEEHHVLSLEKLGEWAD